DAFSVLRARVEAESSDGIKLLRDLSDNPICSVTFDANVPCISLLWRGYATSIQFRFIYESVLRLLEKEGVSKILGDYSALPTIHSEDQSWMAQNWMPRAVAGGLRALAQKYPESHFGKVSLRSAQSVAPAGIEMRSFDSLTEAREWLRKIS